MDIRLTLNATTEIEFGGKVATLKLLGGEVEMNSLVIEHGVITFKVLISDVAFEKYKQIRALGK